MKVRIPLLVLASVLLMAASCSDPPPRPRGASAVSGDGAILGPPDDLGLLSCTPLMADSVTQTVGPSGGLIQVGPHTLSIPADALPEPVAITAVMPSDTVNVVHFSPEGLEFASKATLHLSYANCNLLGLLLPKRVAYTDDQLNILELLVSVDFIVTQRVRTKIDHFSGYAVAW